MSRHIFVPNPDLRIKSPNNYRCHKESDVISTSFTPPARATTFRYLNAMTGESL